MTSNELSKFTEAMAYHNEDWIPGLIPGGPDPGRRRWLFQILFGPVLANFGFLAASITGRILSYGLYSLAFAALARSLRLHPVLAVIVVAALDYAPSIAAGEWLFTGFEPKTLSYPLIFLCLSDVLNRKENLRRVALLAGLACSFHPLVGLYGTFAVAGVVIFQGRGTSASCIAQAMLVFALSAVFAIRPIAAHLLGLGDAMPVSDGPPSSWIYVYLRSPHHLDPSSWESGWWQVLVVYLLMAAVSYTVLRWLDREKEVDGTAVFGLMALLPFLIGLVVAPFDTDGSLLQFYPFRFGDVVVPLVTYLFVALLVQRILVESTGTFARRFLWLAFAAVLMIKLPTVVKNVSDASRFPGPGQGLSESFLDMAGWVGKNSGRQSLFLVPPAGFETMPWLTRRRVVITFKQTYLGGDLQGWYSRMTAVGNLKEPWDRRGGGLMGTINSLYREMNTARASELMRRFGADYLLTFSGHALDLPVAFSNRDYTVYALRGGEIP